VSPGHSYEVWVGGERVGYVTAPTRSDALAKAKDWYGQRATVEPYMG